jgi:hypothetical protein
MCCISETVYAKVLQMIAQKTPFGLEIYKNFALIFLVFFPFSQLKTYFNTFQSLLLFDSALV